ncbi:MAG: SOS response-associated peptidase [Ilumatobacteraceae bacterium]
MCGRFVSSSTPEQIAAHFGADVATDALGPNFNVAPTHDVYGVVPDRDGGRRVDAFHWGLVPSWAKDRKVGDRMINARAETLGEKPAFKKLFATRRCVIPMDGFYEWMPGSPDGPRTKAGKPAKRPVFVRRVDGEPLAVAGLWAVWKDPDGAGEDDGDPWLHSATVITTGANATMAPVHDRMPVILPDADVWDTWLEPDLDDLDVLGSLLVPAPADLIVLHEVSTEVNDVRNRGAHLVEPVS